jgi:hypothetical protein
VKRAAAVIDPLAWRDVHPYINWDEADAQRQATIRDNPTLDVRLDSRPGHYVLQVRGPIKA